MTDLAQLAETAVALTARPGDTLLIAFAAGGPKTMAEIDDIRDQVRAHVPGLNVVVFQDECSLVVYKPDEQA